MNLGDRWEITINPSYGRSLTPRQFVDAIAGGNDATYGTRYIFASIEQSSISMSMRVNYSLTPDLTIEAYLEPFAASGHYSKFGELAAAGSGDLISYSNNITQDTLGNYTVTVTPEPFTIYNPDFNVRSFRSNLVIRWEWLRGSTLYVVWQQNRFAYNPTGDPVTPTGWLKSFTDSGDQVFAVKMSYWLPVD
jgi:hypothetical protein